MRGIMRRGLTFSCAGATLAATLDDAPGETALLIVTGGRQTRIGPQRGMAALAGQLAQAGHPVLRFDRRGVGDSEGVEGGFRSSAPDIAAAAAALREACPQVRHLWGLGLCDGATAIALHHRAAALDGVLMLNPWVVEAEAGAPPPAAVRAYYRDRLLSIQSWKQLLTKGFNPRALLSGIRKAASRTDQSLADEVATALGAPGLRVEVLLAERDATARAFTDQFRNRNLAGMRVATRDSASHSFGAAGDQAWLTAAVLDRLSA